MQTPASSRGPSLSFKRGCGLVVLVPLTVWAVWFAYMFYLLGQGNDPPAATPRPASAGSVSYGRVLVTGGGIAQAEVYDPATGTFSPTGFIALVTR
jgi:hypothetical protein